LRIARSLLLAVARISLIGGLGVSFTHILQGITPVSPDFPEKISIAGRFGRSTPIIQSYDL
jgi:hypothetical protein